MSEQPLERDGSPPTGSAWQAETRFWAVGFALGLVVLSVERVALFVAHRPVAESGGTVAASAVAFVHGLRFDAAGLAYLFIPALLGSWLLGRLRRSEEPSPPRGAEPAWVAGVLCLVTLLALVDFHFFAEFRSRLDFVTVEYLDDPRNLVMIGEDHGWFLVAVNLGLAAGLAYLFLRVMRRTFRRAWQATPARRQPQLLVRGAVLAVLVVLARGGISGRPLRTQDADASPHRFVNQLTLSGPFTLERCLYEAFKDRGSEPDFSIDPQAAPAEARGVFSQGETFLDDRHPALRRGPDRPRRDLNVVVLVMESVSGRHVGALAAEAGHGLAPQFDLLAHEGVLFTRCYANGPSTNRSIPAIVSGFPCVLKRTAISKSVQGRQEFLTFGRILADVGYQTAYGSAPSSKWENLGGWLRSQGFGRIMDLDDFADDASISVWGPPDDVFLRGVADMLDDFASRGPFAVLARTATNHPPFVVPDDLPEDLEQLITRTRVPGLDERRIRASLYSDWAVGRFVRRVRASAWGKDTVFVLVGDHGVHVDPQAQIDLDRRHVPLLFLLPESLGDRPREDSRVASLVDVVPSILGLLGHAGPHASWGRDLFADDGDRRRYAVMGPHGGQRVYGIVDDRGLFLVDPLDGRPSLFRVGPDGRSITPEPGMPEDMERLQRVGRSYLQTAHEALRSGRAGPRRD